MKDYEMVMILDPGLDSTAFEEKTKFLQERLKSYDGVIQNVVPWGKRKLAYDIDKKDAGYYVVFNFQMPSRGLLDFKESIRHDQDILRYLIVVNSQPVMPIQPTSSGKEKDPVEEADPDSGNELDRGEENVVEKVEEES